MKSDLEILADSITELVKETKFAEEKVIKWTEECIRLKQLFRVLMKAHEKMKNDPS